MGGFDVIDPRYRALFERARLVLSDDRRVRSVSLGGSVGDGTADQWSDLDLTVVTEPGPFISLIQRGEHLRHLTGVPHLLGLLTTVFLAETGQAPPGKIWNQTYTAEQRGAVAALPAVRANRDDLVAFCLATARLTVDRARPLFRQHDLDWPASFARVAADRLRDKLGIETADWLS